LDKVDIPFSALRYGGITLRRITMDNAEAVLDMFSGYPDSPYMTSEIKASYLPETDAEGRPRSFGFYAILNGTPVGLSLLGVSSWPDLRGFTGADTLLRWRGRGIAPGSKPHLFYLGFYVLGLNRIETGCLVSNLASKRSIEKTPGFVYEGRLRSYARNEQGVFEDEYRYAILRDDWLRLYDPNQIEPIP
jgi:RimJ/RimL family protein N-acetyltransferase